MQLDVGNPATPDEVVPALPRALAAGLALGRIAIGAGLMVAPDRALGALGFETGSAATLAAARLAGVRDLVLGGAAALALGDRDNLLRATVAGAAADAGDVAVFASALAGGDGSVRRAALRGIAAAAPATVAGVWVGCRLR